MPESWNLTRARRKAGRGFLFVSRSSYAVSITYARSNEVVEPQPYSRIAIAIYSGAGDKPLPRDTSRGMGGAVAKISARIEYLGKDTTLSAANINYPQSFALSDPEAQILLLLNAGKVNAEVAAEVGTDQAVVKEHIKSILRKAIGYRNRAKHLGDQRVTVQSVRHPTNPIHLVETT